MPSAIEVAFCLGAPQFPSCDLADSCGLGCPATHLYFPPVGLGAVARQTKRMAIRLIALDIDGTLLDARSQLPDINRHAVMDARARGIEIALVTGRPAK